MQQTLQLKNVTPPASPQGKRTVLGKGLVLSFNNELMDKARLYRGGVLIKSVDLTDKVAKKLFIIETIELGAIKSRLADTLELSRQTLHNYQEIHAHFGVEGLIHGYRMIDGKDLEKQRALHADQRMEGNKAQQVAAIRAAEKKQNGVSGQFEFFLWRERSVAEGGAGSAAV